MTFDPRTETLGTYQAGEFRVDCIRCRRQAVVERYEMMRRYGADTTLIDCARRIAASRGCNLAGIYGGPQCSVQVFETDFWTWGRLRDARYGGWRARLYCRRRLAALKRTESCPGSVELDVPTLVATLGDDYPVHRLHSKSRCPQCGTESVEIEWFRADPPKDPAPIKEKPPEPVRLRPTRAQLARTKLGVAKG